MKCHTYLKIDSDEHLNLILEHLFMSLPEFDWQLLIVELDDEVSSQYELS